jgi:hypothetical protein
MLEQPEKIVRYFLYWDNEDNAYQASRICASPDIIHEEADKLRMGTIDSKGYENVLILREE